MNIYDKNEFTTSSDSDSEYLVDSRYCRTTIKCKRKALKKTIKLIHGRCVVVYRGSGDLLSIAAKDADRNGYCDFVFICHDPKPTKLIKESSAMPRSRSAKHDSSISHDDDDDVSVIDDYENVTGNIHFISKDNINNNYTFEKQFVPSNFDQQLFSCKTKLIHDGNHNDDEMLTTKIELKKIGADVID